jgi:hypothetical protein
MEDMMRLDDLELECQHCGCPNLHHVAVDAHARIEDRPSGEHVSIAGLDGDGPVVVATLICETCDRPSLLGIAQHEGAALLTLTPGVLSGENELKRDTERAAEAARFKAEHPDLYEQYKAVADEARARLEAREQGDNILVFSRRHRAW